MRTVAHTAGKVCWWPIFNFVATQIELKIGEQGSSLGLLTCHIRVGCNVRPGFLHHILPVVLWQIEVIQELMLFYLVYQLYFDRHVGGRAGRWMRCATRQSVAALPIGCRAECELRPPRAASPSCRAALGSARYRSACRPRAELVPRLSTRELNILSRNRTS